MKNKLKTMLHSVIAVGFALLLLILFEIPYFSNMTGYNAMELYKLGGFLEFVVSFFQFFHIITVLLLLNIGIFGILQKTGIIEVKKSLKGWTYAKLVSVLLIVIASLSIAELIFVIITCVKYRVYIGVGAIMNSILEIIGAVLFVLLDKNGMLSGENHSTNKEVEKKEDDGETKLENKESSENIDSTKEDKEDFEKFANQDIDTEKL